jgi:hypothetical protein
MIKKNEIKKKIYAGFIIGAAVLAIYGVSNVVNAYNDAQQIQNEDSKARVEASSIKSYSSSCPYCPPASWLASQSCNDTCANSCVDSCGGNCGGSCADCGYSQNENESPTSTSVLSGEQGDPG